MTKSIDRPIFLIGSGRSGTTLLLDLLTKHPDLAWFSNWFNLHPNYPWLAAPLRIWDIPIIGSKIAGRIPGLLHSHEAINVYKYCGIRDLHYEKRSFLIETDVTCKAATCMRGLIARYLAFRGKKRFITKNTNNCARVRYLKTIFPDAQFIHIIRDGRAVAYSLLNVEWWPNLTLWWSGFTPDEWKREGNSPIELCARHWQHMVHTVRSNAATFPSGDYIEIKYEDLVKDTMHQLSMILEFCDLPSMPAFENAMKRFNIYNSNYKWRKNLSKADKFILEAVLADSLEQMGYETD